MKTILVPTDFSEVSENAAYYAAELATLSHAKVIFLHNYSIPSFAVENPGIEILLDELRKTKKDQIRSFDIKLRSTHANLETELVTTIGFPSEEIVLFSERRKVDLIVMGITPPEEHSLIAGSHIASVIKESKCAVLTIPGNAKFRRPKRIALGCDYSSAVPYGVVERFKAFVKLFKAKVLVFDVLRKAEMVTYEKAMAEENLEELLSDVEHSLHFPSGDDLIEEMNSFVDSHLVDILVMIPHNYTFLQGLWHHSNTKQMALHTHIPLLTIHE